MQNAVKEIKTNSFTQEETDALLTVGQSKRYNNWKEFMKAAPPSFHITDISKIERTPLEELWQDYDRCQQMYQKKVLEGDDIEKRLADLEAEARETTKRLCNAKNDKGTLLSLLNSKDYLDADNERKTLAELNGLIEALEHRLGKVKTLKGELSEKQKVFRGELARLKGSLEFPTRYLLRGISEDIKESVVKKVTPELRLLAAIGRTVSGGANFKRVFDGVTFRELEPESIIDKLIEDCKLRFAKEGA